MDDLTVAFNVVVVEDDPLTRLAVELVFVDDEDFRLCWHAGSLSRALELAAEETRDIDLVVLDDVLQGAPSGAELAPLLKHLWPAARVVLFSADPDARRVTPCVDAAVRKTEPELLLARSRALLGLPRPAAPSAPATVPAPAPASASPVPLAGRQPRRRGARPSSLASALRLAAVAAAVLALVSTAGLPAPRRLVAEAVGFATRLVPGMGSERPEGGDRPAPPGTHVPAPSPVPAAPVAGVDGDSGPSAVPPHGGDGERGQSPERPAIEGDEPRRGRDVPTPAGAGPPPASPAGGPSTPPSPPDRAGAKPGPSAPAPGGDRPGRPAPDARPAPPEQRPSGAPTTTTSTTPAPPPAPAQGGRPNGAAPAPTAGGEAPGAEVPGRPPARPGG